MLLKELQTLLLYWKFSEPGDDYIGRNLSGLYPFSADFGALPLHFTVPSEDPRMQEALNLCFEKLIEVETARTSDGNKLVKAIFSRGLASLIFH